VTRNLDFSGTPENSDPSLRHGSTVTSRSAGLLLILGLTGMLWASAGFRKVAIGGFQHCILIPVSDLALHFVGVG